MIAKPTPGPWQVWRERKTGERIILGGDACALCDVHPGPNRDADARLIAKAPEMYDLLRQRRIPQVQAQIRALLAEIDG